MALLLDCTLRDGGYYTNWDFSEQVVNDYFDKVNELPIDYVEIGYRNPQTSDNYVGEFFHLDVERIQNIRGKLKKAKIALMLDAKCVKKTDVPEILSPLKGTVDLVRIAVNPDKVAEAIELGQAIVDAGFKLAFNVMYISTGKVNKELVKEIASCGYPIEFFYLVDSYGGAQPEDVAELVDLVRENFNGKVGFHGHNNMELALANSMKALVKGVDVIDATVLGMGRGSGNLKTELYLTYLLGEGKVDCNMEVLSELVNVFKPLHEEYNWGTNLPYMIAGAMNIPQGTVMNWISTDRYSENDIVKKVMNVGNTPIDIKPFIANPVKKEFVVVLGGGPSLKQFDQKIRKYIKAHDPRLVLTGLKNIEELTKDVDEFVLCLSGKQLHGLKKLSEAVRSKIKQVILPPHAENVEADDIELLKDKVVALDSLDFPNPEEDSPLVLALEFCRRINLRAELIGFDGYPEDSSKGQILNEVNQHIFDHYSKSGIEVISLTDTRYKVKKVSIHARTMML